ncbi:MAG: hypothetical protein FWH51_00020 [Dehalococcoidia bacterium]|nr:hypothetical protein [Dehalococcoidia bacterium]
MAPPLKDSDYCRMHCPEHAEEVQEARRLGGLRRKQEVALSGTWDFKGLESASDIRRLIEVAALDTLSLENSLSRNRTLVYIAQVALRALETNEYEQRLIALEQAMRLQQKDLPDESIFLADEPVLLEIPYAEETDATS